MVRRGSLSFSTAALTRWRRTGLLFGLTFLLAIAACSTEKNPGIRAIESEQARAALHAVRAERARRSADRNRHMAARLAQDVPRHADVALQTRAPVTVAPAPGAGAVDEASIAPNVVGARLTAAAAFEERAAATEQRLGAFHPRKAGEMAAAATANPEVVK
jgi:hypothetical protein